MSSTMIFAPAAVRQFTESMNSKLVVGPEKKNCAPGARS